MKFKVTVVSLGLLMANSVFSQDLPYYTVEEIDVVADGAQYGPFPVAMSEDEELIATYSMKASLSANIDIGLPFTFNRECQYDDILCELAFYGSDTAGQRSYENAYQAWRNAQSNAQNGNYTSYMFANVEDAPVNPFDLGSNNSDVKVTDVYASDKGSFVIGYASAPYNNGKRAFVRRAFIQSSDGSLVTQLLSTPFTAENGKYNDQGGFSSAYKIKEVNGKVWVIGHASTSYPRNDPDYFNDCYNSDQDDDMYDMNELVRCPGFDTQAWVWDVTDIVKNGSSVKELSGSALASKWLDKRGGNLTFSANAFDIDSTGIAVGASTFKWSNSNQGGRQRAIIMTPSSQGVYSEPKELTAATNDIKDQQEWIYNTWALTISEAGIVTGNREYEASKGRNKATEFFVYNNKTGAIRFPLKDKKIATKKQSIKHGGDQYIAKSGANSRVYAANEAGWMVGEVDDFDQLDPVYQGSPRSQTAFLFDNKTNQAWLMNDLICKREDGVVVQDALIRIRSARVIGDGIDDIDGNNGVYVVLAEGFKYDTPEDYKYKVNGKQVAFRLTPNPAVLSPNDSPNCWDSALLETHDQPYERQGGATFWLWIFALPLLFIRRFKR